MGNKYSEFILKKSPYSQKKSPCEGLNSIKSPFEAKKSPLIFYNSFEIK